MHPMKTHTQMPRFIFSARRQGNVGAAGVLSRDRPRGLSVPDQPDLR
jgi:hypothetical protein